MDEKIKILFVDDEPAVLESLRRMLRPMHKEWDMRFANGGPEALKTMERETYDLVVTDMRMPGMDGAQLLTEVKKRHPETMRVILSGQVDHDTFMRATGSFHQFLSKPCEPELLKNAVGRAYSLHRFLANQEIKKIVSSLESIPSLPKLYNEVMEEVNSRDPSMTKVGQIIAKDMGMTAKILQLANSVFFGSRQKIIDVGHAVQILGLDFIQPLILSFSVFSSFDKVKTKGFSMEKLWKHSWTVGEFARRIAGMEKLDRETTNNAVVSGLLHDVGKLVIALKLPGQYLEILKFKNDKKVSDWEAEYEVLKATHAGVGAYILGLWGLSAPVMEAVAYHHCPSQFHDRTFSALTVAHVANALELESGPGPAPAFSSLDETYLKELGLLGRLLQWREKCVAPEEQDSGL